MKLKFDVSRCCCVEEEILPGENPVITTLANGYRAYKYPDHDASLSPPPTPSGMYSQDEFDLEEGSTTLMWHEAEYDVEDAFGNMLHYHIEEENLVGAYTDLIPAAFSRVVLRVSGQDLEPSWPEWQADFNAHVLDDLIEASDVSPYHRFHESLLSTSSFVNSSGDDWPPFSTPGPTHDYFLDITAQVQQLQAKPGFVVGTNLIVILLKATIGFKNFVSDENPPNRILKSAEFSYDP